VGGEGSGVQGAHRLRWQQTFPNHRSEILRGASHNIQEDALNEIVAAIKTGGQRREPRRRRHRNSRVSGAKAAQANANVSTWATSGSRLPASKALTAREGPIGSRFPVDEPRTVGAEVQPSVVDDRLECCGHAGLPS